LKQGFEKYDVDFKSLQESEYWIEVHDFYKTHIEEIAPLIDRVEKKYGMDFETARDSILYEVTKGHIGAKYRENLFSKKRSIWTLKYISFLLFSLPSGFLNFIFTHFLKSRKYDVLYEEMWEERSWFSRFYKYIDSEISEKNRAILFDHPAPAKPFWKEKINGWSGDSVNRRYGAFLFEWREVLKVFWKEALFFWKLWKSSKETNLTYIYLRFLRKVLLYKTQVQKVEAKNLIMAGDYYWNPVKYFQFKKRIRNIVLIQHNIKDDLINRTFIYCDFYFTHSEDSNSKVEGVGRAKLISVGSFQLIPFLEKTKLEYDILFINQTVHDNLKQGASLLLDQEKLIEEHEILLQNFQRYISERDIKAIYVAKPGYVEKEPFLSAKEILGEKIEFVGAYGSNMFQLVQKSKLILNMYSSVGREAYGLDKRVLWINYNECCSIFKQDVDKEELHTLLENGYGTFRDRVDLLLSDSDEVDIHFQNLKREYMNIEDNPAKILKTYLK
jgi:hypothetical protein